MLHSKPCFNYYMTMVVKDGQSCWMLWKQTSLFRWLNALDVSAGRITSVAGLFTTSRIVWIVALIPLSCPAHNCKLPTASHMSSSIQQYTCSPAFAMIHHSTSPIPICLTPGFLSSGMRCHDRNASREKGLR